MHRPIMHRQITSRLMHEIPCIDRSQTRTSCRHITLIQCHAPCFRPRTACPEVYNNPCRLISLSNRVLSEVYHDVPMPCSWSSGRIVTSIMSLEILNDWIVPPYTVTSLCVAPETVLLKSIRIGMSSPGARRVEVGFRFVEVVTFRSPLIPVSAISIMKSGSACVSVASSPKSADCIGARM